MLDFSIPQFLKYHRPIGRTPATASDNARKTRQFTLANAHKTTAFLTGAKIPRATPRKLAARLGASPVAHREAMRPHSCACVCACALRVRPCVRVRVRARVRACVCARVRALVRVRACVCATCVRASLSSLSFSLRFRVVRRASVSLSSFAHLCHVFDVRKRLSTFVSKFADNSTRLRCRCACVFVVDFSERRSDDGDGEKIFLIFFVVFKRTGGRHEKIFEKMFDKFSYSRTLVGIMKILPIILLLLATACATVVECALTRPRSLRRALPFALALFVLSAFGAIFLV